MEQEMMECGDYVGGAGMGSVARGKLEDFEAKREFHAWISGIPRVIAYVQGHLWNVVQRGHNVVLVLL